MPKIDSHPLYQLSYRGISALLQGWKNAKANEWNYTVNLLKVNTFGTPTRQDPTAYSNAEIFI